MPTKTSKRRIKAPRMPAGVKLVGPLPEGADRVLTPEAVAFAADLVRRFTWRIDELLAARAERQKAWDSGWRPSFPADSRHIRETEWSVAPLPPDLLDRRVEITGPVDRKMIINALNSGASIFMADFEDSNSPTRDNIVGGQANLQDAVRRTITYVAPETGKSYKLNERTAVLMVRPRGLHLPEKHLLVDGRPAPGCLVDFAFYLFHNARELLARGTGPYLYLPKTENALEARFWNDVFLRAEEKLGLPRATIKATVLVETLPASFEMDEILWELREHSSGLNCGRWDYIFSFIKRQRMDPAALLPDRAQVTMDKGFLNAYVQLLIRTCHRRNVHAMGGMAAQIPIKDDPAANEAALEKVRADKLREVQAGHDGTWVAHPGLVGVAMEIFDAHMKTPNLIHVKREDVRISEKDLLQVPEGTRTEEGLRHIIRVSIQYLEAWLRGTGCVPIYNLMEDAATAEISRAQVWQWIHHRASLSNGELVTPKYFRRVVDEEMERLRQELGEQRFPGKFKEARRIFEKMSTSEQFEEFLTLPAYDLLIAQEAGGRKPTPKPTRRRSR
jgi:malate synthase A